MSTKTGIEWTDATWNPIRGCSRVSEGCRNCYAEKDANRFKGPGQPYEGLVSIVNGRPVWSGQIRFVEEHLLDPLKWKKPQRIFVNSMSDLFHENVTDEMLDKVFAVMALCPQHTFQVLTKRPVRMLAYLDSIEVWNRISYVASAMKTGRDYIFVSDGRGALFLGNVQLGVSVENQPAADKRIPLLLQTPAAVRFISAEPLLGPIDLTRYLHNEMCDLKGCHATERMTGGRPCEGHCVYGVAPLPLKYLDWVIVGGESGPGARPMHPDWARSLRDQCVAAGVPFFFKQHGEWLAINDYDFVQHGNPERYHHQFVYKAVVKNDAELPISCYRVGKKAAGRLLDGHEWNEMPR